ncbi:hypothetical protein ACOI1C_21395 [Bacillus sp. DJP31]|uniref:hypothetical protein n=1 Tax=Bacillus sp. DJP31 TaxID=3409789 RepID=UPI003BB67C46
MELDEIIKVYETVDYLKREEGQDVMVTIGVLFNTGLRGHALSQIKVKDVLLDKELIIYKPGVINNKHTFQYFPIPPRLLEQIKHHIQHYDLQPDEQLLNGLSGKPLQNKQINWITNRINKILGWEKVIKLPLLSRIVDFFNKSNLNWLSRCIKIRREVIRL